MGLWPAPYVLQVTQGDNATERPMWAERGGLDFEGRARWDAWTAVKGLEEAKAKLRFVKVSRSKAAHSIAAKEILVAGAFPHQLIPNLCSAPNDPKPVLCPPC